MLQSQVTRLTPFRQIKYTIPTDGVITLYDTIFQQDLVGMTTSTFRGRPQFLLQVERIKGLN